MHCVIELSEFSRSAAKLGMTEDERHKITMRIANDPMAGDLITGTGGARKLRFPYGGKGKSGGVRVITYFAAEDVPVFLLNVYSKGVRINMTKAEKNEVKKALATIADDYRAQVQEKLARVETA